MSNRGGIAGRGSRGGREGRGSRGSRGGIGDSPMSDVSSTVVSTEAEKSSPIRGRGGRERERPRGTGLARGRVAVTDADGHIQATSTNLPKVNFIEVAEYF